MWNSFMHRTWLQGCMGEKSGMALPAASKPQEGPPLKGVTAERRPGDVILSGFRPARLKRRVPRSRRRGAALIIALALMTIFSILGTMYVRHMALQLDEENYAARRAQARQLAVAGIQAAIGDLRQAVAAQAPPGGLAGEGRIYDFNAYQGVWSGKGLQTRAREDRRAQAHVTVADENARVNINHVPASVLARVLGVDSATARAIAQHLPRPGEQAEPGQWFLHPGGLVEAGLLTEEQFAAVDQSLITARSVGDRQQPRKFINVNSAPAPVMAAILDLPEEQAAEVVGQRPFASLEVLAEAAGKAPGTFNIRPEPGATELPGPLALYSRCFRIRSEGAYSMLVTPDAPGAEAREYRRVTAHLEAIVEFSPGGETCDILYWNTRPDPERP